MGDSGASGGSDGYVVYDATPEVVDLRGYKATDPITITELRSCKGPHCRHPARAFRAWSGCCRCDAAHRHEVGEPEFEEKTHGGLMGVEGPLLGAIDRKVVAWANREGDDEMSRLEAEDAYDLAAYLRALDNKLRGAR